MDAVRETKEGVYEKRKSEIVRESMGEDPYTNDNRPSNIVSFPKLQVPTETTKICIKA